MVKRNDIDENVYNFVRSHFDKNYTEKYNSYDSTTKNCELKVYINNVKSNGKISVSITKKGEDTNLREQESYEFSIKYSKLLRYYFEDISDGDNQDYIRNKNESILKLIKNIEDE